MLVHFASLFLGLSGVSSMSPFAFRRIGSFALLAFALAAWNCTCSNDKVTHHHCTADSQCPAGTFCDVDRSQPSGDDDNGCHNSKFQCTEEGQCCPGQDCPSAGICFDKGVRCTLGDSSTCTVAGQVCKVAAGAPSTDDPTCTFDRCSASNACADGLSCFNGYCVGEPPCHGGCAAGSVCTPVNNRCFQIDPKLFPKSCSQSCEPGTILVFKNGYNVFNRCNRQDFECACEPLPPVKSNDLARYSSAAMGKNELLVSAYDGDHGDLVMHEIDKASLKITKTTWIDGVPTTGAVIGDPNGPRGGRDAPGPDVGRYTSLAYDSSTDTTHIAYYAVEDDSVTPPTPIGDLKYATKTGSGPWKVSTVDGSAADGSDTGDVGMYASLTLSPDGFPVIAYFQKAGTGNNLYQSAVKVARAKVRQPQSQSDWTITTIETGPVPPPPCSSPACQATEVCTQSTSNPNGECRTKAQDGACNPACKSTQACALNASGQAACFDSLRASTLAQLPDGDGLFPSVRYLDSKPVVVWYDHTDGVLKGVIAASDSAAAGASFVASDIKVLDDGVQPNAPAGSTPDDVGRFASLAVGGSGAAHRLAVAYYDVTLRQLRVLAADDGWANETPVGQRVVDNGAGANPEEDPLLFVGANPSLRFDAQNALEVAYQDSTSNDLRLAVQQGSTWKLSTLQSQGACGFYANLVVDGQDRYATSALIKAKSATQSANQLVALKVP